MIPDLYVEAPTKFGDKPRLKAVLEHIDANRALRWEDGLEVALRSKKVSVDAVKRAFERNPTVKEFFAARQRAMTTS